MNKRDLRNSIILHSIIFVVIVLLTLSGALEPFEVRSIDHRFENRGYRLPTDKVKIVGITDRSIFELGGFPLPRTYYAQLIEKLQKVGARVVGIDLVLDSAADPDEDRQFAQALQSMPTVMAEVIIEKQLFENGDLRQLRSVLKPWDGLITPRQRIGFINMTYEDINQDGILRAVPLSVQLEDHTRRSFAHLIASTFLYGKEDVNSKVLDFFKSVQPDHFYYINYYNSSNDAFEMTPLINFFNGEISDQQLEYFRDCIVLLGPMAPALGDLHHTPYGTVTGIEVHAAVISNILKNEFLTRQTVGFGIGMLLLFMLLISYVLARFGIRIYLISVPLLTLLMVILAYFLFSKALFILDISPFVALTIVSLVLATLYEMYIRLIVANLTLKKKVEELGALYEISKTISDIENLEIILGRVLKIAVDVLSASRGSLMLYNEETGMLNVEVAYVHGMKKPELEETPKTAKPGIQLLPGEGVAGVVFEDMKPVIINKGSKDPRFKSKQVRDLDVESLLCTPMIRKDRCIGVINISNRRNHTPFQDADKSLMEIVSHHAATVIENARLYKLATVDGLTQLYVVRYFKVRLLEEFLRATRYRKSISVLMSDIDHFKNFNDTYGHQMGDIVLASVAGVVRETVRLSDFAARYGGEEFIVILPETDGEGAYKLAERVREQVENLRVPTANGDLSVTISVGVVTYPDYEMETSEEMIACADAALYQAKQTGRNKTCVFTAEMAEDS